MLSTRYHIATIIAIFLSLGIGIVIGGTLGQRWTIQAENSIVHMLTDRYEMLLAENQVMKKQIGSLELLTKTIAPSVQNKVVWWLKGPGQEEPSLALVLHAAGIRWIEKDAMESLQPRPGEPPPDYILVTDPIVKYQVEERLKGLGVESGSSDPETHRGSDKVPLLIDISDRAEQLNEPDKLVEFMLYMKQLVEEDATYAPTHAPDFHYHTGME